MKLLLHICCAPCLIYPLERLREKDFVVNGLFYNPNIYPLSEYEKRKQAVEDFGRIDSTVIIYSEYNPKEFFEAVNFKNDKPQRCSICWLLRLKKTAQVAKEKDFNSFSTTLLVSPYQDQTLLKNLGNDVAREIGIDFYYEDFRPGFKKAHNEAKVKGIYCQKYCGCIYSEVEKCQKSEKH